MHVLSQYFQEQTQPAEGCSYHQPARENQKLQVVYRDLSQCTKPQYLPQYKANCWGRCKDGQQCSEPASYEDIQSGKSVPLEIAVLLKVLVMRRCIHFSLIETPHTLHLKQHKMSGARK